MIKNILHELNIQNIDKAIAKGFLEPNYYSSADHAYIVNKKYYFKEDIDISYYLKEKIVEMIAQNEGIETVDTKYVQFGKYYGELAVSFFKDGKKTVNGTTILNAYKNFLAKNNLLIPSKPNNLETIRKALKYYFDLKEEQLDNLMSEFLKRYMIDLLTMQNDRTTNNWEVFVDEHNNFAGITPMYDSNKSLKNYKYSEMQKFPNADLNSFLIKLSYDEECVHMSSYEEIFYFLEQVDIYIKETFENLVKKYSPIMIENYCYQLLNRLGIDDKKLAMDIIRDYSEHYQILLEIIKKSKNKEGRSL